MCSIVEDDFGDDGGVHAMKEEAEIGGEEKLLGEICKKCGVNKTVVQLSFKEAQCKNCFLLYVHHKFRAALGAKKIVPRGSNVLICFDGSSNNVVLLDMINFAISQNSFKRLHFNPFILFIDESCCTVNKANEDRSSSLENVKEILQQFAFTELFYGSIAEDGNFNKIDQKIDWDAIKRKEQTFFQILNDMTSLTAKQDLIRIKKRNIIQKISNYLDCKFVFTSEIGSDLAKTLLANVALGRGRSTAFDISFVDDRFSDLKFIRPIRDLNDNEVKHYVILNELKCLDRNDYGKIDGQYSSIQNLTDSFVDGLQINFPSTVSTVFRTGDKLSSINQIDNRCRFCQAAVDYEHSKTLFAIEYSRIISANLNSDVTEIEHKAQINVNGDSSGENNDFNNLKKNLCHGCRNIFIEVDSNNIDNVFIT